MEVELSFEESVELLRLLRLVLLAAIVETLYKRDQVPCDQKVRGEGDQRTKLCSVVVIAAVVHSYREPEHVLSHE